MKLYLEAEVGVKLTRKVGREIEKGDLEKEQSVAECRKSFEI